jgi:hypothetical protein
MATLAARQYGIVTRDQLTELGFTERAIDHYLRAGRLQTWHRDVLAVGNGGINPHGLCQAAVMLRGKGALISHQSAIWLWGLERKLEIPVHVSVRRRGRPRESTGFHHCPTLRAEDFARTERLPVTAVPRTLLDYAAVAPTYRLDGALDRADRLGLLDPAAIDRITDHTDGHPGCGPLRDAMAIYREVCPTRDDGEDQLWPRLAA